MLEASEECFLYFRELICLMSEALRNQTLDIDEITLASERIATKIKVFVGGPEIAREWIWKDWRIKSQSARLRSRIHRLLENQGHESVLGEHQAVGRMTDAHLQLPSVAFTEQFIIKRCNCVILVPDSPGSFCELGAWSDIEKIGRKMLILFDERFQSRKSYINPHVIMLAEDNGATVKWVNYAHWQSCKPEVENFVRRFQEKALRRGIMYD
ncbi:MAG: hypothetical protein LH610_02785 [Sphingomonas bacterium]|nr:hypothetical protein [Sphingomonas bacterium]